MPGLLEHAKRTPDRPALVFGNGESITTYAELERRSRLIGHWLRSLGLKEGDCIAILLDNSSRLFDIYWASQRVGLYLTPINWHLAAAEISYIIDNCDAKIVIAAVQLEELAEKVRTSLSEHNLDYYSSGGKMEGFASMDHALTNIDTHAPLENQRAGSVMIYSSGTTGQPKGIRKPLPDCAFDDPAFTEAQTRFIRLFGFKEDDHYLCPAPLYHAAPMRSCAAMHTLGGTVFAMQKFDAELALQIIQEQNITVSQWVPTHFKRLLTLPEQTRKQYDISTLRVAVHAAAPCPTATKQAMIDWWGPLLLEYYAGTEGGGTILDTQEWLAHPGSVGKPWSGVEVTIFDDNMQAVSQAETPGSIYFRDNIATPFVYHKNREKTREVYWQDWFTLGDIGYTDKEGYLYLTDRRSNMIISGGVNIYPQEAENCLLGHAKVQDAAVIGVTDEEMGEQVKALVIPVEQAEPDAALADELIQYVRDNIAHYKCPRSIDFVTTLPRTETGKLQKRMLKGVHFV